MRRYIAVLGVLALVGCGGVRGGVGAAPGAALGAADSLPLPAGALQTGAGAFLGQGVDVTAYRRLRDSFLDLQVRAQSMALGDATTTITTLQRPVPSRSLDIGHQLYDLCMTYL